MKEYVEETFSWREEFYRAYRPCVRVDDFESRYPYLKRLIRRHVPPEHNIRIADIGCGAGTTLAVLERLGYRDLLGVDASNRCGEAPWSQQYIPRRCVRAILT